MKDSIGSIPPFGLRMPSDVKAWVERTAHNLDRSQNYVIVQILKEKMTAGSQSDKQTPAAA